MALTRIPRGWSSFAAALVNHSTGALEPWYVEYKPVNAPRRDVTMEMIAPPSLRFLAASWMKKKLAFAFVANIESYSASEMSTRGFFRTLPTVWIARSSLPPRNEVASLNSLGLVVGQNTHDVTAAAVVRSAWMAVALTPRDSSSLSVVSVSALDDAEL